MEALGAIQERVRNAERRLDSNHESINVLRGHVGTQDVKVAVISADLEDIHEDILEVKGQLKWVLRGLWAAAATFLMFAVALAGMVLNGAH
jgi:hypothetical protein